MLKRYFSKGKKLFFDKRCYKLVFTKLRLWRYVLSIFTDREYEIAKESDLLYL
jgi:hypothetical protein